MNGSKSPLFANNFRESPAKPSTRVCATGVFASLSSSLLSRNRRSCAALLEARHCDFELKPLLKSVGDSNTTPVQLPWTPNLIANLSRRPALAPGHPRLCPRARLVVDLLDTAVSITRLDQLPWPRYLDPLAPICECLSSPTARCLRMTPGSRPDGAEGCSRQR
jgi:hypothetical protein